MNSADGGDLHGERPGDSVEVVTSRERLIELLGPGPADPSPAARGASASGVVLGGSAISASVLADLAARGVAELRPLLHPGIGPAEPRYRPSGALADFIRCRDLTCRFPGCDCPAELCDIDHTVPYGAGGPTHPSNLKLLCRKHHLMKTFWTGTGGWRDEQHPDGTVVWTSPSGHVYRTSPGSALLVPALCVPTGQLEPIAPRRISPDRGVRMPQRKRTRAADRHHRIMRERRCNSGL